MGSKWRNFNKLVDFAGDGYAGANPDTAGEIVFTHDVSSWKSVDLH